MKNKNIIWCIGIILFVSCTKSDIKEENPNKGVNKDFESKITLISPVQENPVKEISFTGKVETDPDLTTAYIPQMNGIIERSYFSLGDKVSKGQALLDIRSTELSALQAELTSLEAELKSLERELISAKELYSDRLLSESEYLQKEAEVRQAKAALDKAQADIAVYGKSKANGVFTVTAPISGYIITKRGTAAGSMFSEGEELFSIADLSQVWVIANVYAGNLQFVKEGIEADITSISYPDEVFTGKVDAISQVFDPEDKTLKARIALSNKEMKLKPEMPVMVNLRSQYNDLLLSVPSDAIIFDKNRHFAVVRKGDDFMIKEVTMAGHHGSKTYIRSGLSPEDVVVGKNQLLIYNELSQAML